LARRPLFQPVHGSGYQRIGVRSAQTREQEIFHQRNALAIIYGSIQLVSQLAELFSATHEFFQAYGETSELMQW